MGAKEEIELLTQKVDILYNVVLHLAETTGQIDTVGWMVDELFDKVNVDILTTDDLAELGLRND